MNCNETKELLFEYLKNRLPPTYQQDVQHHLSTCPECQAQEKELRELFALLDTVGPIEPSSDFVQRVMKRVEKTEQRDKVLIYDFALFFKRFVKKLLEKRIWPVPAVALASIIAIVAINIIFWQNIHEPKHPTIVTTRALNIHIDIPPSIVIKSQRDILPDVRSLIEGYGGRITSQEKQGKATILMVRISQKYEKSFLESLKLLGDTKIGKRYKNQKQEIIIKIIKL